jgi:hypothetical protein
MIGYTCSRFGERCEDGNIVGHTRSGKGERRGDGSAVLEMEMAVMRISEKCECKK